MRVSPPLSKPPFNVRLHYTEMKVFTGKKKRRGNPLKNAQIHSY